MILVIAVLLIGCGKKSQKDIIKELGEKAENVKQFEVDAVMEITDNDKKHVFDVNVKYAEPNFYKVTLENRDSNNAQIILKNKEGVFVLNPSLNKSFKFQSEWPMNSSQPYLFQSLVKDILNDEDVIFVKEDKNFVFETKVDYMKSKDLVSQKVIIDGKTLFPREVIVYDAQNNERINVLFNDVNYKPNFKEKEFDVQESMTTAITDYNNLITVDYEREMLYPTFLPDDMSMIDEVTKNLDEEITRSIMTFDGEKPFTVVQEYVSASEEMETELVNGDLVILGTGAAFATNTTIVWYDQGLELQIVASTIDDLHISVANSMAGEGK